MCLINFAIKEYLLLSVATNTHLHYDYPMPTKNLKAFLKGLSEKNREEYESWNYRMVDTVREF